LIARRFFPPRPMKARRPAQPAAPRAIRRPEFYKVFQFPPERIPRINGNTADWDIVPEEYVVGMDQLVDDAKIHARPDLKKLDVRVRVGWVKGLNRLYFLYEAKKDFWDFSRPDLHNDTFEIVVDGDLSGGPLIAERRHHQKLQSYWDAYFSMQNVGAQNYHIFTPAREKDWCMVWGPAQWLKELPYAQHAYDYHFAPGEGGKLALTFYITPFDYAGADGPPRAVESQLAENKIIGVAWAVMDYRGPEREEHAFWNLSPEHTMYGDATQLMPFKLMPLEPRWQKALEARWSFRVADMARRLVAFRDESVGRVTSWRWDFGDGTTSSEQHPQHAYAAAGHYIVILDIAGPAGKSRLSKVWDVVVK
jgi:hypothetical protein